MTYMIYPKTYDVIVVGGGHAGTEAALAAARMGAQTLLLSHNIETLGQMSCNPSIGGIGKGHLVRELDALGGAMALATDKSGIQFRRLNASKGAAVRATRAQADRILYKAAIREMLENQENLDLFQQAVEDVTLDGERISGVVTAMGVEFKARAVVLTAGTFLSGKIHIGLENYEGGRAGDPAAKSLGGRLRELNLPQGRLKTLTIQQSSPIGAAWSGYASCFQTADNTRNTISAETGTGRKTHEDFRLFPSLFCHTLRLHPLRRCRRIVQNRTFALYAQVHQRRHQAPT